MLNLLLRVTLAAACLYTMVGSTLAWGADSVAIDADTPSVRIMDKATVRRR
jgi:hypothetical protein